MSFDLLESEFIKNKRLEKSLRMKVDGIKIIQHIPFLHAKFASNDVLLQKCINCITILWDMLLESPYG